jgi:hypothetical protein
MVDSGRMFFQSCREWPMDDKADPLAGWPIWEVRRTPSMASQDAYGKLFVYLREMMRKFLRSLDAGKSDFELYNIDAKELPQHLNKSWYDRIEVGIPVKDQGFS